MSGSISVLATGSIQMFRGQIVLPKLATGTGKDRTIKSRKLGEIGMEKTLVFYTGRAPRGNVLTRLSMSILRPLKNSMARNLASSSYDAVIIDTASCSLLEKLLPCLETAKAKQYDPVAVEKCCPDLIDVLTGLPCFCTGLSDIIFQGAVAESIFNGILGTCKIKGTMKSLCFGCEENLALESVH